MQSAEPDRRNTRQISRSTERAGDATNRNNNLTLQLPELTVGRVPIYESTFCLCGNKHFNLSEGVRGTEQLLDGETAEQRGEGRELISSNHV